MKTLLASICSLSFSLYSLQGCSISPPPPSCDPGSFLANGVNVVRELTVRWESVPDVRITTCEQTGSAAPVCVTEAPSTASTASDGGPDVVVDGGAALRAFGGAPFAVGSGFLREKPDGKAELSMFLVSGEARRGQTTRLTVRVRDADGVEQTVVDESVRWSNEACAPSPDRTAM